MVCSPLALWFCSGRICGRTQSCGSLTVQGITRKPAAFDLAIDPGSAMYLSDVTIDYVESLEGAGFKIDNPNAGGGTCGCGKSFAV